MTAAPEGGQKEQLSWLERALRVIAPVRKGEATSALLLTLNVFILLTLYYVLKVVREPLILLGGGAELKAYASAGQTLLLLGVVPLFGILASRVNRVRLLTTVQLIFVGCLIAFYVLAQAKAPIGLAFYLWLGIFNVLVMSNFWSFANDLYTQEQGKRLFPIVGMGGSIGAIIGAFLPPLLGKWFGPYTLMLVAAGGLLLSVVIYRIVDRRERIERDERGTVELTKKEAVRPVEKDGGFTLVIKDKYLRLMAVLVLVSTLLNTAGEYVISRMATDASKTYAAKEIAKEAAEPPTTPKPGQPGPAADQPKPATPEEAAKQAAAAKEEKVDKLRGTFLGNFFSSYYGLVNLISALIQGLLVSRILAKLGVKGALFVMPVIVLLGWVGFLAFASLTMIRITKTAENGVDYSLQNTVKQALYLPTSRASKYKAKAAIDTFFFRMGDVMAGLVMVPVLVNMLDLGVRAFAAVNLVLGVIWISIAVFLGRLHDKRVEERAERKAKGMRETLV